MSADRDEPLPVRRLVLELAGDADRVAGALVAENGDRVAFSGWLGLAAAIDLLCERSSG